MRFNRTLSRPPRTTTSQVRKGSSQVGHHVSVVNSKGSSIRIGYVNVIAKGDVSNQVAVGLFRCQSANPRPDPYIFSQWDEDVWDDFGVSGDSIGWYNPDISVYQGTTTVDVENGVLQTNGYSVWITVHNQGEIEATETIVSLWSAPIGGGVSWKHEGDFSFDEIGIGGSQIAKIPWQPEFHGVFCLKAVISGTDDMNDDNNEGVLAVNVIEYSSPGDNLWIVLVLHDSANAGQQ